MPSPFRITREAPGIEREVRALLIAAFGSGGEAELVAELRDGGHVVASFVAHDAQGLAGYVMFSKLRVQCKGRSVPAAALAPLAVREDCRRQGAGERLVREGLAICQSAGIAGVIVLGDPAYYGRFGFFANAIGAYDCAFAGPALQGLELVPGAFGSGPGRIDYPQPFSRFISAP